MSKLKKSMKRWLFILVCVSWVPACWSGSLLTDRYDEEIKRSTQRYMPGTDWRLFKAQLYQESLLNPTAQSPVGAQGLAQFMPGTWADVSRQLGFSHVSPFVAKYAIQGGAYYMGRLRHSWSSPRPDADRHSLAMASYNAGFGNLLKAQRLAGGASAYGEIIMKLPDVTGHYSNETITYVERIWSYYIRLVVS